MKILQADPGRSYKKQQTQIVHAVKQVLSSSWYIMGSEVEKFENSFAREMNSANCVSCANGTDAIELALRSLNIGPGDQVVTVANSAVATAAGIFRTGATAVFADVDEHFTMCPDSLEKVLERSKQVRAIVAVHLFGNTADMTRIVSIAEKWNIPVVEDCAQAHGAKRDGRICGTWGKIGCFSFYPTKNLGAFGDGGAVITDSLELAEKMRILRQYGWKNKFISECNGINSRLDELQAAILNVKLPFLKINNARRCQIAKRYSMELAENPNYILPVLRDNEEGVFHQYVIRTKFRDELQKFLSDRGIGSAVHYPCPIHLQPAYKNLPLPVPLPVTEKLNREILSLPMYPELTDSEVTAVIQAMLDFKQP